MATSVFIGDTCSQAPSRRPNTCAAVEGDPAPAVGQGTPEPLPGGPWHALGGSVAGGGVAGGGEATAGAQQLRRRLSAAGADAPRLARPADPELSAALGRVGSARLPSRMASPLSSRAACGSSVLAFGKNRAPFNPTSSVSFFLFVRYLDVFVRYLDGQLMK